MRHLIAIAAPLALAACGAATATEDNAEMSQAASAASVALLSTAELSSLVENGNIRLIDVRRDDEVAQGMIPGAEHIMLDDFDPAALDLSDGREVVLYCRSGRRSGIAGERLATHTGEPAQHLAGGIIAWQAADNPITSN